MLADKNTSKGAPCRICWASAALAPVTKRTWMDGFVFSNAAERAGSAVVRSAAAATVRVVAAWLVWAKKKLSDKKASELDNLTLIFDTNIVLKDSRPLQAWL